MINFSFKNFDNTDEVISAVISLDLLSKDLHTNGYDFANKHLHKFTKDYLKFHIFTSFGDVTDVTIIKDEV
jgi:hypothetical protein